MRDAAATPVASWRWKLGEATTARSSTADAAQTVKRHDLSSRVEIRTANANRFQAGDASLVEVLPVRRDWTRVQLGYLSALREVMVAWSELQVLTAAPTAP